MKRQLWRAQVNAHHCPPYQCCACSSGVLQVVPKTFISDETARSKAWRTDRQWDPDWIDYIFSLQAKCNNPKCAQLYFLTGAGGVEQNYIEDGDWEWSDAYYPKTSFPMPHLINFPNKVYEDVKGELIKSFETFWRNPDSCANSIRNSLDKLMINLGFSSTKADGNEINLLHKIELFSKSHPELGANLMSVKWLCNTGTHGRRITHEELLDAYEIYEFCLEEIIEEKSKKIAQLAAKLNEKHNNAKVTGAKE
ncbi:MAG: DUF4145 domain-containing protein [Sphingomonadales bacterium]|nr:DUF4145 domain-containing protein [Sphingomonadales bacterium]